METEPIILYFILFLQLFCLWGGLWITGRRWERFFIIIISDSPVPPRIDNYRSHTHDD